MPRQVMVALVALVALVGVARPLAQNGAVVRLAAPAGASVKSALLPLSAGELLQVTVEAPGGAAPPNISVFVHDEDGELLDRDDPESVQTMYSWRAPGTGRYYVLARNSGAGAGTVIVTRREPGSPGPPGPQTRGQTSNYATVRVFFATDRSRVGSTPARFFGTEPAAAITYGHSDVSVPRDHRLGELEGPSIFRLEFRSDPEKHVTVLRVEPSPRESFASAVRTRVAASTRKEALLFVHGFNVSFEDAVRRAAQLAYDLAFDGPALVFSWPSQEGALVTDYRRDERNAELSVDNLRRVMMDLLDAPDPPTLHVIAHSMGNRVLAGALQQIAASTPARKVRRVAMIAPDIDAELFRRAAGRIAAATERLTLYASSADAALRLSQTFAGYPRAGQGGAGIVVVPGMDTIDASSVDTSLTGLYHSYYADNSTVLSDLFAYFRGQNPDARFGLAPIKAQQGMYWLFRPAAR
ncbi:MAG TPA: alpha/beta hydrolase [Vicinamibacterales bacterium]|nr:alpha/beta hydrolase [Vicinamibacterales bacterium]